jgi:hypothetical protein
LEDALSASIRENLTEAAKRAERQGKNETNSAGEEDYGFRAGSEEEGP